VSGRRRRYYAAAALLAVVLSALASGGVMLGIAYAAVPALVLTFLVTWGAARTLPRSDGKS